MSFTDMLVNSCTIQRYTEGDADAYGTKVKEWADHLTGQACRLMAGGQSGKGREVYVGAEVVIANYTLFIGDVDITEQDRIIVDSVTYEVLLVADKQDAIDSHHNECYMRAVR